MDMFSKTELSQLMREQTPPCVTLYLPTHVAGADALQDPVRLKNLLQQAEDELSASWMRPVEARRLLQPARELPNDPLFWNQRGEGLAIFLSPDQMFAYRLPIAFDEMMVVSRRFHVKPLLPLVTGNDRFLLLALSQNHVRLFSGSRWSFEPVEVPDLPDNMKEALNYTDADRGSQTHTAMRGDRGKQSAVFHGQGGLPDSRKDDLTLFFRQVDAALRPVLREETRPLVLAGAKYLLPIYRKISNYPHIADEVLEGNYDYLTPHQIHQKAWPLLEPRFRAEGEAAALAHYRELAGASRSSYDLRQIVSAAMEGRIETLLVDNQAQQWGRYDPETGDVELHDSREASDDDLLDWATVQTLSNRGTVYSIPRDQVPTGALAVAVFRY
jgi:hypothetical protein